MDQLQGTFSDRNLVFGEYPTEWLVDHFFEESLGVSYETIRDVLEDDIERWALKEIEDHIIRVLLLFPACSLVWSGLTALSKRSLQITSNRSGTIRHGTVVFS